MNKFMTAIGVATFLTGLSYIVGLQFGWITELSWLEIFSVFTSYACTYLCVVQSRMNYYFGIISVAALSLLFFQSGLYASMILNIYLIPTLVYGWWFWGPDDDTRPVTSIFQKDWGWIIIFTGLIIITYLMTLHTAEIMGNTLPFADSAVLVLSIAAQFLLDRKIIENWLIWICVNIISIPLYVTAGLPLVAFQFVFFLLNAVWGYYTWRKTCQKVS